MPGRLRNIPLLAALVASLCSGEDYLVVQGARTPGFKRKTLLTGKVYFETCDGEHLDIPANGKIEPAGDYRCPKRGFVVFPPATPRIEVSLPPPSLPALTIRGGGPNACPGDAVPAFSVATTPPPGLSFTSFQWYVNNRPAPGGTGPTFSLPTSNGSGRMDVKVTVTVSWPGSRVERPPVPGPSYTTIITDVVTAGSAPVTSNIIPVTVGRLTLPRVQFTVSPTTIRVGGKLPLNATETVSECATATPIRYTASEGSVDGNTFDSTGVSFDATNRASLRSKVVRLTATETDSTGQTATAIATVTVIRKPPPSRVDIVFANGSSRVTEVDERYLVEDLTQMLRADPLSTVILIGHRDDNETGRALAKLDTQRVLNTAAVLSAGIGPCPSLDLDRLQVRSDGTDQTDPPLPFVPSATDQRAQYRRVEVWFIPGDADRPAMSGVQPAPAREIKAKGCPK